MEWWLYDITVYSALARIQKLMATAVPSNDLPLDWGDHWHKQSASHKTPWDANVSAAWSLQTPLREWQLLHVDVGCQRLFAKLSQGLISEAYFTSFHHPYPLSWPFNLPPVGLLSHQPSWKLLGSALGDIIKLVVILLPNSMMSKVCLKKDCHISKAVVVMDYVMQVGVPFPANIG